MTKGRATATGERGRDGCRSPGSCVDVPLAAPGPALRLPGAGRPATRPRSPGCGSRCGSPGSSSTASCWSGSRVVAARRQAGLPGEGRLARAGAATRGGRGWPARSPTGTRATSPTCCAWPSRLATPAAEAASPPRRDRRRPPRTRSRPAPARRGGLGRRPRRGGAAAGPTRRDRRRVGAYPAGAAFLRGARATGGPPRAVWSALPGEDWPARLAEAAAATVHGRPGRGRRRRRRPGPRPARRGADRRARRRAGTSR